MRRYRLALILSGIFLLLAAPMFAAIENSKHDLGTSSTGASTKSTNFDEICAFCHTPHGAQVASVASMADNTLPLWNHDLSSATYTVYDSVTMNSTAASWNGNAVTGNSVSALCMSCHDGTVAINSLYNDPNIIGADPTMNGVGLTGGLLSTTANVGTDLSNDHPVNMDYPADDSELYPAANVNVAPLLVSSKVQCSSCHDVHDATYTPFLVMSNNRSDLCLTCHNK